MNLYNDINDIPIKNWNKIQKSIIKGKPNYRPLIKWGLIGGKKRLKAQFDKLLYQFPKLDNELKKLFLLYEGEMQKYIVDMQKNDFRESLDMKPLKLVKYETNKAFEAYIDKLLKSYDGFEFEICFLHPKFKEIYKKTTGLEVPEKFNYNLEFFLIEEFIYYLKDFPEEFASNVIIGYQTLIQSERRYFTEDTYSIKDINDRLEEFFRGIKSKDQGYNKWFFVRFDMFNYEKLVMQAKEHTILNDVIILSKILEQNIDIKCNTVGELYESFVDEAEEVIKNSKPKADRYGG